MSARQRKTFSLHQSQSQQLINADCQCHHDYHHNSQPKHISCLARTSLSGLQPSTNPSGAPGEKRGIRFQITSVTHVGEQVTCTCLRSMVLPSLSLSVSHTAHPPTYTHSHTESVFNCDSFSPHMNRQRDLQPGDCNTDFPCFTYTSASQ